MTTEQVTQVSTITNSATLQIKDLTDSAVAAISAMANVQIAAIMGSDQSVKAGADLGIQAATPAKAAT